METLTLEMPTGAVTVVENGAITGEMYATAADAAPMRAAVADPGFETLLSESLAAELHGEGTQCTLTFTMSGKSRTQKWSSEDKPSAAAAAAKRNVSNAFAALSKKAKATRHGGDCATDSDCHFAPGADCRCYAAGPPPTAGHLSGCVADPCESRDKPRCERSVRRCVLGKPPG